MTNIGIVTGLEVFFYEVFAEEEGMLRHHLPADLRAGFSPATIQEHGSPRPPARLISIRTQSIVPFEWAGLLDGILARATGHDVLTRYRESTRSHIPCGYLPLYCARAVAEQAMLLWMALLRKLPRQIQQFATFDRDGLTGRECEHKHLLVVGVGNIGSEAVKIGQSLGMAVRGVDIKQREPSVSYVSKEQGLPWADIIVCAMNLTADNVAYFNFSSLKHCKRGAIFVNVARGEMSPAADLLRLLDEGHLGGVGLDVFDQEPMLATALRTGQAAPAENIRFTLELARRPDVICTPHNAFNTVESVERKALQSAQQVEYFLKNGKFFWRIP
jgi:D-lactate dehydrogenase